MIILEDAKPLFYDSKTSVNSWYSFGNSVAAFRIEIVGCIRIRKSVWGFSLLDDMNSYKEILETWGGIDGNEV
jgi:hypothetical protein